MRLRWLKPLFKLVNLIESHISLHSCWVKVLKKLEHLGKLVSAEARLTHSFKVKL